VVADWKVEMALCLNPQCQKRLPSSVDTCSFCGGKEISEFNSYSKEQALIEEISMENFQKVTKANQPFVERTIVPKGTKGSFKSKFAVRLAYLRRKLFPRK
jgi:hypothetical protein